MVLLPVEALDLQEEGQTYSITPRTIKQQSTDLQQKVHGLFGESPRTNFQIACKR